ncbi:MAG: 50S ribosomal protein L13 [Elusimicrobia bacterium]|nr:50S ribosomal protein L13 [Elusimicrobiota bacterium]
MKTTIVDKDEVKKKWYLIDADGKVLGRLASEVASLLRGKGKPEFSPHQDLGDGVVIINAEKVVLTGKKLSQKFDFRYSGYPGGEKLIPYSILMKKNPEKAVTMAVKGMLPPNKLRAKMIKRLKVVKGETAPANYRASEKYEMRG